jgi:chromate transporter
LTASTRSDHAADKSSLSEVFLVFLRLGLTSFGGPVAHLGYFREEFVARRKWLDEGAYADLVALCQFLPGPASSQAGPGPTHRRGDRRQRWTSRTRDSLDRQE